MLIKSAVILRVMLLAVVLGTDRRNNPWEQHFKCTRNGGRCKEHNDCCNTLLCRGDPAGLCDISNPEGWSKCTRYGDRCRKHDDCCNTLVCRRDPAAGSACDVTNPKPRYVKTDYDN